MDQRRHTTAAGGSLGGPGMMLLSAAIFGYFGFGLNWAHQYTTQTPPQLLIMVVVLKWALRGGAIAFVVSALAAFTGSVLGNVLYAIAGIVTAVIFAAVAIWDWSSPYYSGISVVLLLIFAAWNGFSSIGGLREVMGVMRARSVSSSDQTFMPE